MHSLKLTTWPQLNAGAGGGSSPEMVLHFYVGIGNMYLIQNYVSLMA